MNIDAVVERYNLQSLDAESAFALLQQEGLLAEAFMRLLADHYEEKASLAAYFAMPSPQR